MIHSYFKNTFRTGLTLSVMGILLVSPACKEWLDITPKTQLKESEQFATQEGFIDALFGIYQKASDESLYGGQLTYGLLDILAQRYESKSTVTEYYGQATRYNYEAAVAGYPTRTHIDRIWANSYSAIAQCNYILANVDTRRNILSEQAYSIIKGEALGMRAFLHFDLCRLFAPAYLEGSNADRVSIPYMSAFQVKPQERLPLRALLDRCEADLKAAEKLLSVYPDIDPIAGNSTSDLFLMLRQNHLNYWAVKATLARLYLYKGDNVRALQYATEVIDSKQFRLIARLEIHNNPESASADMTFTPEHIFSVYVKDLKTTSDQLFKYNGGAGEEQDLFTTLAKLQEMYETSLPDYGSDVRSPSTATPLWDAQNIDAVYSTKYYVGSTITSLRQSRIPVIRLSEMYYIAAEAETDPQLALGYLNTVRTARVLPALDDLTSGDFKNELLKAYRKEFFGEGQLWFYYKRLNVAQIPNSPEATTMTEEKYVFPLPVAEVEFGK